MPEYYVILRQPPGQPCQVVLCSGQSFTVLFTGGRWKARRFLCQWRNQIGHESVPAYCEKKARRGYPPALVEITSF